MTITLTKSLTIMDTGNHSHTGSVGMRLPKKPLKDARGSGAEAKGA